MNDFALEVLMSKADLPQIFFVGQAGFIIKSPQGHLLGIDLYLSDYTERVEKSVGFKRLLPKPMFPSELTFDGIIATHAHADHLDADSLPFLLSPNTKLLASHGCKEVINRLNFEDNENISYVSPMDAANVGDFSLLFVPCDHGEAAPDAVGVLVSINGKNILAVGDTCLREDYREEYLAKGGIDVLITPINGAFGNMNEEDSAKLSKLLKPRLTIPAHYGMFAAHGGDVQKFICAMEKYCPDNEYKIMTMGERISLR